MTLIFLSCSNLTNKDNSELSLDTLSQTSDMKLVDSEIVREQMKVESTNPNTYECVRGTAEPVINKKIYPNSIFTLQADSLTGIEIVEFDNGDRLTIENTGCEYFTLNFRFESSRFVADTTNTKYWADKALKFIKETEYGIDAPVELKKGIEAFEKYVSKTKIPKLRDEIDYGLKDIRSFVYLNRIQKIADNKFSVELTFSVGPL